MDLKKILTDNNIKVVGDKISKADLNKALNIVASKSVAGVSNIEIDKVYNSYDEADDLNTMEVTFKAKLDLSGPFNKRVKDLNDEDALDLYDNMDFVNEEFKNLNLNDTVKKAIVGSDGPFIVKEVDCELGFWSSSSFEKVKEDASNAERADSLKAVDVTFEAKIHFDVDTSKMAKVVEEAIKKATEKLYK